MTLWQSTGTSSRKGKIMTALNTGTQTASPTQAAISLIQAALRNRLVLIAAGIAIILGGLGLGWGWLTAIGLAPIILSVAPCLIMCAFGMCMMGKAGKSMSAQNAPSNTQSSTPATPPQASTD